MSNQEKTFKTYKDVMRPDLLVRSEDSEGETFDIETREDEEGLEHGLMVIATNRDIECGDDYNAYHVEVEVEIPLDRDNVEKVMRACQDWLKKNHEAGSVKGK